MASGFPGSIDNFTDPLTTSALNSPSHAGQHQDLNDAVEKIETYMGLVKVIPTGATNGTVGATGTVTIGNAVSSVTVSGAFSSLYDNYLVQVVGGVASLGDNGAMTLGSATTGYYGALMYTNYASASTYQGAGNSNSANFQFIWRHMTSALQAHITFLGPNLAKRTFVDGWWVADSASGRYHGYHDSTTQFTSFTLSPGSGTLTGGTIRVYGYRN